MRSDNVISCLRVKIIHVCVSYMCISEIIAEKFLLIVKDNYYDILCQFFRLKTSITDVNLNKVFLFRKKVYLYKILSINLLFFGINYNNYVTYTIKRHILLKIIIIQININHLSKIKIKCTFIISLSITSTRVIRKKLAEIARERFISKI